MVLTMIIQTCITIRKRIEVIFCSLTTWIFTPDAERRDLHNSVPRQSPAFKGVWHSRASGGQLSGV